METNESEDVKIRDKIRRKQIDEARRGEDRMEEEEEELKKYFKEIQQPISNDPTLIRKKQYNEKMTTYREVLKDISFKNMLKSIWFVEPQTPEELETLFDCKEYLKYRCYEGVAGCMALTSFISFWNRRYLSYPAIMMGVGVGLFSGVATSFLRSTGFVLKKLEDLGPDYQLGRLAIHEIEDFRMDKVIKKQV